MTSFTRTAPDSFSSWTIALSVISLFGLEDSICSAKLVSSVSSKNRLPGGKQLSPASGELMLKILSLFKKGEKIFGNAEEFQKWIERPAYGLGFKVPKELMQTTAGIDLVMDELIRIEYGDLA